MQRRRHSQQRRSARTCAQQPRRDALSTPAGPFIDLSDPSAPKLVGTLPEEFQEFARILMQQATDAATGKPVARGEDVAAPMTAMTSDDPQSQATPAQPEPAQQERAQLISSGLYRTREENLLEISRLSLDAVTPLSRQPQYEMRRDWLGRLERWYSAEEVARHCTPKDLWLIAHDKVYDATSWVETHPGGAAALLRRGGRDATKDIDFHSKHARKMWEATYIGRLDCGHGGWMSPWLG